MPALTETKLKQQDVWIAHRLGSLLCEAAGLPGARHAGGQKDLKNATDPGYLAVARKDKEQ